jgi:pimeloyl-ACP methyl ester carboxylesterase
LRIKKPEWPSESESNPTMDWVEMPSELAEGGDPEASQGRLRADLLEVAGDPLLAIGAAVLTPSTSPRLALAFSELAVTGRNAYDEFVRLTPSGIVESVAAHAAGPGLPLAEARLRATRFVERAEVVSQCLRGRTAVERATAAQALKVHLHDPRPWLAVSGERDPPDRPVNLQATSFNQEDVFVPYHGRKRKPVRVRAAYSDAVRESDAPILLFLHGLGSRLEEDEAVGRALAERGYGILGLDLPNQGYSERLTFEDVGLHINDILGAGPGPTTGATLEFYTHFLGSFVRELDRTYPGIADRLVAVGGGSQGGCLALRLSLPESPVKAASYIPWSPGAVWTSFKQETLHPIGLRFQADRVKARDGMHLAEEANERRADYIRQLFDNPMLSGVLPKPVDTWWRDNWPAKPIAARDSRMLRWEVYHKQHRLWCEAMGYEQLVCSFRGPDDRKTRPWPIEKATEPMLLMTGDQDNMVFANIRSATEALARRATRVSGHQVTFLNTGHSIHDERPNQLAREIDAFLEAHVKVRAKK